jgi:NAD(P)-dependent dehydrogenase (short-subunit alcohol dehydrogenase family)
MRSIVMTGGTAGIGLAAAERMRRAGDVRVLVGARDQAPDGVETRPLDLARLASVRCFASSVGDWLGDGVMIDALVLNAGTQVRDLNQRTEDGFETTFAVNHLAHYLLLRLLTPRLADGAIVVVTASNLHDPNTNPIAPPAHADARLLARGQVMRSPGAKDAMAVMRAYAASKLCNVLTTRALALSDEARARRLTVIAFNPGFTPGTQLTRNHSLAIRSLFSLAVPILGMFQRPNTVAAGGNLLADLALGRIVAPEARLYASQVRGELTWPQPSELASDDAVAARLWRDSAAMVGLGADQ